MFGMNETYSSKEEKAYDRFVADVAAIVGVELVEVHESMIHGLYEDHATVEETVEEIRAQ